jgi:hypothetical protein
VPFLFFEAARHAHEKRYSKVDFGDGKPFIMDGVFRFKKKIGARIKFNDTTPIIHAFYFPQQSSHIAAKIFEQNPVIVVKNNRLVSFTTITSNNPPFSEVCRARRKSAILGVSKAIIAAPHFDDETKKSFSHDKTVILVEEPEFSALPLRIKDII